MDTFIHKLKVIFGDASIRNRILFVLGALVVFRMLAAIPIPGVDVYVLKEYFENNQFLGLMNIFSGGGLSNLSIVMLGVGPYITASIIMQLLTVMSPALKSMHTEEGEAGRQKFMQYSRMLTLPLAILQAFGFLTLLQSPAVGVLEPMGTFGFVTNVLLVVGGSLLLMWIGELVTEYGIGNGVSIIIFAGIVASLPTTLAQLAFSYSPAQLPLYLGATIVTLAVIYLVVVMTEAERPVPITYAKQTRGGKTYGGTKTYLPLRLNQAGVIPIIFALSILLFPQMIVNILSSFEGMTWVAVMTVYVQAFFNNLPLYGATYFALVFLFTFFYTAVTFDPEAISKNLQRSGAFVPGIRPGGQTAEYLGNLVTRLTLVGAIFLGAVAVLPIGMQLVTGMAALSIGGTALLIMVSVVLDLIRRIDAQVSLREY